MLGFKTQGEYKVPLFVVQIRAANGGPLGYVVDVALKPIVPVAAILFADEDVLEKVRVTKNAITPALRYELPKLAVTGLRTGALQIVRREHLFYGWGKLH